MQSPVADAAHVAASAKSDFQQAKGWMLSVLATFPEGRLLWKPAPTARSPLAVVAHTALAAGSMLGNLRGDTFSAETTEMADAQFLEAEAKLNTVALATALFDENEEAYYGWLDALTDEMLGTSVKLPFGLPEVSMPLAISFMSKHVDWHTAQLNYIQTLYGDRIWR